MATIGLLRESVVANAAERGVELRAGLHALAERHHTVVEVHGLGLMSGVSFREPAMAAAVRASMQARKVLVMTAGHAALRFMPPLVVTADEMRTALDALEAAVNEMEAGNG